MHATVAWIFNLFLESGGINREYIINNREFDVGYRDKSIFALLDAVQIMFFGGCGGQAAFHPPATPCPLSFPIYLFIYLRCREPINEKRFIKLETFKIFFTALEFVTPSPLNPLNQPRTDNSPCRDFFSARNFHYPPVMETAIFIKKIHPFPPHLLLHIVCRENITKFIV